MIQKKICMVGSFATGKTSLVARFVKSIYSEIYQTTVGVKIDKKVIQIKQQQLTLMLWDLNGEDEFQKVQLSYLRGSSGYFLVVDGTRRDTLYTAFTLQKKVEASIGNVPFILILNKTDLVDEWDLDDITMELISKKDWSVIKGSAKTGLGVEEAFMSLGEKMLEI